MKTARFSCVSLKVYHPNSALLAAGGGVGGIVETKVVVSLDFVVMSPRGLFILPKNWLMGVRKDAFCSRKSKHL